VGFYKVDGKMVYMRFG